LRFAACLAVVLLLAAGLFAGLTIGASATDPTTSSSTTEPSTSTTEPTTTTTTEPTSTSTTTTTTTQPTTTTTEPTTTNTSTAGSTVTTTNAAPPVSTTTTQAAVGPPETTTVTTTVTAPTTTTTSTIPTAPCDTTAITCGNNAATQLALVSQTCNASSAGTILSVQVETLAGAPVNNVTIQPTTSCLNIAEITQVVEQFCNGCTVIVIPPPPPVIYVPVPGTNTITTQTVIQQVSTPSTRVEAYCLPPALAATHGGKTLLYLPVGTPQHDSTFAKAIPASFVPGLGMRCVGMSTSTVAARVPMFTLTVPASFVGQSLRLCLQGKRVLCHTVRINLGASVSIPVSSSVVASVVKTSKPKTPSKTIKSATSSLAALGAQK
jgi:hypothetical protein